MWIIHAFSLTLADAPRASRRERAMRRRERRSLNSSAPPSLEHLSRTKAIYQQQLYHAGQSGAASSVYQSNFQQAYENLNLANRMQRPGPGTRAPASQLCKSLWLRLVVFSLLFCPLFSLSLTELSSPILNSNTVLYIKSTYPLSTALSARTYANGAAAESELMPARRTSASLQPARPSRCTITLLLLDYTITYHLHMPFLSHNVQLAFSNFFCSSFLYISF